MLLYDPDEIAQRHAAIEAEAAVREAEAVARERQLQTVRQLPWTDRVEIVDPDGELSSVEATPELATLQLLTGLQLTLDWQRTADRQRISHGSWDPLVRGTWLWGDRISTRISDDAALELLVWVQPPAIPDAGALCVGRQTQAVGSCRPGTAALRAIREPRQSPGGARTFDVDFTTKLAVWLKPPACPVPRVYADAPHQHERVITTFMWTPADMFDPNLSVDELVSRREMLAQTGSCGYHECERSALLYLPRELTGAGGFKVVGGGAMETNRRRH